MSAEQVQEIRNRLDTDLSTANFERDYRSTEEAATQFFQDLFVQILNFEETPSPLGDATWQDLPVHEWPNAAHANAARLFAEAGNFRVIYVELEKMTRTAERTAIQSLTRSDQTSGWAIEGSFLTVFHSPDENIWHLVTPYEEGTDDITTGRPVLRRYTLGEGETHRTVAKGLAGVDASKGRLADRINEAFRVKPVTEDFYENYKSAFDTLSKELRGKGLEIEDADRYAHVTLNRLMFFYYLQKKGWIGERKDFVRWFQKQYQESDDEGEFHKKWLSALFFDGMNELAGEEIDADLPTNVESAIAGLPYMNGGLFQLTEEDELDTFLSDSALKSVIEDFLEQYNFTVTEESPYDIDVAVDPAMLGKIYESLIAEQERGEAGIFYTPRVEVDLMCRMALYEQFCDHANDLEAEGKQRIVEFIFSEPQDWDAEDSGETEQLENILHELRIVDPACGSGAFLVGMKQVLTELYRKVGMTPDYHLKEQIINENLYGVDIKDWAVRVAEFRLWLSLVESEEQLPDQRPVLPNFSFKLKVGDSLIQKLDGEFVSLDMLTRTLDGDTSDLLTELRELKREHFEGETDRTQEIEEKQVELLKTHIDGLIDNLSKDGSQQTLFGDTKDDRINDDVGERIEKLEETRDATAEAGAAGFFMWDIDFSDVMVEGGFDIVIGNPPYVRQEDIIDQGIHPERLEQMDSSEVSSLKKQYKSDLVEYVDETFDISPYKRSDIYVYFFFKGIDLLREGGTLTYITSNSWLDVNYGKRLQEGLLRHSNLKYLLDNRAGPIFEDADVNTVISLANRKSPQLLNSNTEFLTFEEHYENIVQTETISDALVNDQEDSEVIEHGEETLYYSPIQYGRRVSVPESSLWRLGGGSLEVQNDDRIYSENTDVTGAQVNMKSFDDKTEGIHASGSYSEDSKWGIYLQAPDVYFRLMSRNHDEFTPLVDATNDVFFGIKSGANDFYFPDNQKIKEYNIGNEYLHPLVKSPRNLNERIISPDRLDRKILKINGSGELSLQKSLQKFIEWGEDQGYPSRRTIRGRDPWYDIGSDIKKSQIVWQRTHYTKHAVYYSDKPVYATDRFYGIEIDQNEYHPKVFAALLNSTFYALVKVLYSSEMSGRSIDTAVYELESFPVPSPEIISDEKEEALLEAFEELDQHEPEAVYDEFDLEARSKLDEVVFDILDANEEEREKVYQSVEKLIKQIRNRDRQR